MDESLLWVSLAVGSCRRLSLFALGDGVDDDLPTEGRRPILSAEVPRGAQQPMAGLDWLPGDNGLLISSHRNGRVHLWESEGLGLVECISLRGEISCHAMNPTRQHRSVYLAAGHHNGILLLDLRAGASVQALPFPNLYPTSLRWDRLSDFCLLSGSSDGSLREWDIRQPARPLRQLHQLASARSGSIVQMEWLGPDLLVLVEAAGFVSLLSTHSDHLLWRTELDFQCLVGFAGALVQDVSVPMLVMPCADALCSVNLHDGSEMWRKPCVDFKSDHLVYNHARSVGPP